MHPNSHDAERHAALLRFRRAQRAEARRIHQAVAVAVALTPAHLRSPYCAYPLTEARQVAMYLMRARLTWPTRACNAPFPARWISRLLGHWDHATVLTASP